ncbi:Uncharacterised protein [uncultured archaeon]|nr:Uncharacterised protein [uncultured archaeon]
MKKFICKNCGVVNEVADEALSSNSDWLDCTLPQGFEWILPAGKITPIMGDPIYISGLGEHLSRNAYLDKYNIDPERAYNLMRGRVGVQTASRIFTNQDLKKASASTNTQSNKWLDDDDWTS